MKLLNVKIILIELCIFIKIFLKKQTSLIRFLTESNSTYSMNTINKIDFKNSCYELLDCFNCSLIPTCRWVWENESCISFQKINENYSISLLSNFKNINELSNHANFIRKSCIMSFSPYTKNDNYLEYNQISLKYCGLHYIINNNENINKFKIEINNINGIFSIPNLFCEFIILSGPSFDANIKINEKEINNFYLLYSKDSLDFIQNINYSTSLHIDTGVNKLNTFVFYSLKSFDKSPFIITYQTNFIEKTTEAIGYIMIALACVMIIIIVIAIVYIRKKSKIFQNKKEKDKEISFDETEKFKKHYNKQNSEDFSLKEKKIIEYSPEYISNFSPPTNTPAPFLNGQAFIFEICCLDNKIIENMEEIKKFNCGHFYHVSCFNKLIEEMKKSNKKELKCISCQKIIYP